MQLNLTDEGVLSKKSAGTQKVIDLSSDAMPEGTPKIRVIADSTFYGNGNITSVKLPETLEVIGGSAFYSCSGLGELQEVLRERDAVWVDDVERGAFRRLGPPGERLGLLAPQVRADSHREVGSFNRSLYAL